MSEAVIVGGGITGLAAAYRLQELAPSVRVTLVEREERLGGKILTEQVGEFVIEGGPDCFLSRKARGVGLCEELGAAGRLQGRNEARAKTYVARAGQLYPLPEGLSGMVPTNLDALASSALISPEGRARLAQDLELPAALDGGDESVAHFVSRRLGSEVFDWLVEPLMGGIYAGDAAQLSLAATFPQLREVERRHGSLIRGLLAGAGSAPQTAYPPFVSFQAGMGELVERLQARLTGTTLRTGSGVVAVVPEAGGYAVELDDGERLHADALLLATPAFVTARLVGAWDAGLAAEHAAIPYASCVTLSLAYDEARLPAPLDGYGYVIPRVAGQEVLACTWTSSKWAQRAPEGYALIRLYLGRYGGRELTQEGDEALLTMAQEELARTLGLAAPPDFYRLYRWPQSMPQYTMGHPARLARIAQRQAAHPGLFLGGAAYRGVGIPDCIHSGEEAARGMAAFLRDGRVNEDGKQRGAPTPRASELWSEG